MQSGNNLVLQHLALHRDWLSPYITIQWHEPDIFSLLMIIFLLQTSSKTSCNCELNFVHMYSKIIRYYRNVHKWFLTDWLSDRDTADDLHLVFATRNFFFISLYKKIFWWSNRSQEKQKRRGKRGSWKEEVEWPFLWKYTTCNEG